MRLDLRMYGDPALRTLSAEVAQFDDNLQRLVLDMFKVLKRAGGIGLAANQVGVTRRVFVVDLDSGRDDEGEAHRFVAINPRLDPQGRNVSEPEGCLSLPGIQVDVKRQQEVVLYAQGVSGKPFELRAGGLLARAIQHEVDHLDGRMIIDRISALRRRALRKQLSQIERGELPSRATRDPLDEESL